MTKRVVFNVLISWWINWNPTAEFLPSFVFYIPLLCFVSFPPPSSCLRPDSFQKGHVWDKGCLQLVYFRKWFKEQALGRSLEDEKANHPEGPLELPPFAALALSTQTITSFFLRLFLNVTLQLKFFFLHSAWWSRVCHSFTAPSLLSGLCLSRTHTCPLMVSV